jgi:hypothetical protein
MLMQILFVLALLSRLPQLERCQIFEPTLVDPLLKGSYKGLPRLPRYSTHCVDFFMGLISFSVRMAEYAPTWGSLSQKGGFNITQVKDIYDSPDEE